MSKRSRVRDRVFPVRLRESALEHVDLAESPDVGAVAPSAGGTMLVQLISAGWGSSGYYSDGLLREAATAKRFPSGLPMYLDHPTETEDRERPERSVRDLAAVLTEDARYDDSRKALVATAKSMPTYRHLLGDKDFCEAVGLSIRAGGLAELGEADGRKGLIVREITEANSVDYVTKAGRGGKVLALMESARTDAKAAVLREARNVGAWLESRLHLALTQMADDMYGDGRLTREERIALSSALGDGLQAYTAGVEKSAPQLFQRDLWATPDDKTLAESLRLKETTTDETRAALQDAVSDAYGGKDIYCWVRDFDPDKSLVWFSVSDDTDSDTFQQGYGTTGADTGVSAELTGARTQVTAQTVYVPVPPDEAAEEDAEDGIAAVESAAPTTTDVTEGAPPTGSPHPIEEETAMAETQTGAPPAQAGTATVADAAVEIQAREAAEAARSKAVEERDTALREADEAKRELAALKARESARPIATTKLAESDLPAAARARVLASVERQVPLTEALALDEARLTALIEAEATAEKAYLADLAEADGAGKVQGFGQAAAVQPAEKTFNTEPSTALVEAYTSRGMSAEAARLAALGRPF